MATEEPAPGVDLDALVESERATLEEEREKHRKRQAKQRSNHHVDLNHPDDTCKLFFNSLSLTI